MRLKNFYRVETKKGFRLFRPRTFISRLHPPRNLIFKQVLFPQFRSGLRLYFSPEIHRYLVYKEYREFLVLIGVVDSPGLKYREPGEWILWAMRKNDIYKSGGLDPKKAIKEYGDELLKPETPDIERERKVREIQREIEKDVAMIDAGRVSYLIGAKPDPRLHKKMKKEKVVFGIHSKTGKVYIRKRKQHA